MVNSKRERSEEGCHPPFNLFRDIPSAYGSLLISLSLEFRLLACDSHSTDPLCS